MSVLGRTVLLMLLCTNWAHGAPMSWQDIVRSTIAANPELAGRTESVRASRAGKNIAYAGFLPNVSLVGTKSDANTQLAGRVSEKELEEYGIEAGINLFNGFHSLSSVARGHAEVRRASAEKAVTSADLRFDLRQAYLRAIYHQENLALARRIAERQRDNLGLIRLKYKSGREAKWSLTKAQADLEQAELTVLEEETEFVAAKQDLLTLMGMTQMSANDLELSPLGADLPEPPREKVDLGEHPQQLTALAKYEAAIEDVRIAKSDHWPSIDAAYSLKRQENEPLPEAQTVSTWALTITFNVFDGLATKHRVEKAGALREVAAAELTVIKQKLFSAERIARARYEISRREVPVAKASFSAARARVKTVTEQFKLGLRSFLDWEQAQGKLIEAEKRELLQQHEARLAYAQWQFTSGRTLEEEL